MSAARMTGGAIDPSTITESVMEFDLALDPAQFCLHDGAHEAS
jgi:hypothetical protein